MSGLEPTDPPQTRPTTETRAFSYEEVPNNHLSPMGQVDDIGRFARGMGPERLTKLFRVGLIVMLAIVVIGLVSTAMG